MRVVRREQSDVVEASWLALCDGLELPLLWDAERSPAGPGAAEAGAA